MASEVISHAIFASSHPTPPRTAPSYTPPSTPRFAPPRAALRLSLCPSPCLPPCTPLCIPPELHPAPSTPLFTLLCAARHPIMPFTLRPYPIPNRSFPSHFFAPQDSLSPVPPSTSLHLPPVRQFPSHPRLPTLRVPQPSPACGFSCA